MAHIFHKILCVDDLLRFFVNLNNVLQNLVILESLV